MHSTIACDEHRLGRVGVCDERIGRMGNCDSHLAGKRAFKQRRSAGIVGEGSKQRQRHTGILDQRLR